MTLTTAKNKINLTQFNTAMYKLNCTYLISLLIASNCSCSIRARVWASVGPLGDHMSKASITDSFSLPSSLPLASNACCSFSSIWACFNFSCSCSFRVLTWNTGFSFYFICKISAANFHKTNNLTTFLPWWGPLPGTVLCPVVTFEWPRPLDFLSRTHSPACQPNKETNSVMYNLLTD